MNFDHIKMVSQPKDLKIKLFPHQLASIYNMEKIEVNNLIEKEYYTKETKIGINADLTGYGKTLSIIGLLVRDKMEWDLDVPFIFQKIVSQSRNRIKTYYITRFEKLPTTLILVSPSILGQWEKEFKYTNLKVGIVKNQKNLEINAEDYDVILVIPTYYNKLVSKYSDYAWKRFIFDEPGHLKVSCMKEVYSNFYWFITATPYAIQEFHRNCRTGFVKDIISDIFLQSTFSDITIKNNEEFVKYSFNMPETIENDYYCYQPLYNVLQNFVSPSIKTMIEAGNIEGAINALGGEKTSNIIDLVKTKKEKELKEIEIKIIRNKMIYNNLDNDELKNLLLKQKNIEVQITDISRKYNDMLKDSCSICFNKLISPIFEQNCQNMFCGECFLTWLNKNNTCPLCRTKIDIKKIVYIKSEDDKEDQNVDEKVYTKEEKIIDIIKNNKDGKFLIFSEYDKSFFPICNILKENKIKFLEIKGSSDTREKNLELFKNGDINVIFLNSKTNGAGINLQEATDIILYHEMNSHDKNQILGRANRIGRKVSLNVHNLLVKN